MRNLQERPMIAAALVAGAGLVAVLALRSDPVEADPIPVALECEQSEQRVLHLFGSAAFGSPRDALQAQVDGRGLLASANAALFEENHVDDQHVQLVYREGRDPLIVMGLVATGKGTWAINQFDYCLSALDKVRAS